MDMMNHLINIGLLNQIIKMKKNEKKILFNKKKPDSGQWILDFKKHKWIEDYTLKEKDRLRYTLRRENGIEDNEGICGNSKYIFHIDSFPRQGNTTLRSILLKVFPDIVIPDPMVHVTTLTDNAIKDGEIVISTIRDPHDTLSSYISRKISKEEKYKLYYLNKNKIHRNLIKSSIKFYNRYQNFLIQNNKNIYLINFENILQMYNDYIHYKEDNNFILRYFSEIYNLKFIKKNKECHVCR